MAACMTKLSLQVDAGLLFLASLHRWVIIYGLHTWNWAKKLVEFGSDNLSDIALIQCSCKHIMRMHETHHRQWWPNFKSFAVSLQYDAIYERFNDTWFLLRNPYIKTQKTKLLLLSSLLWRYTSFEIFRSDQIYIYKEWCNCKFLQTYLELLGSCLCRLEHFSHPFQIVSLEVWR